MNATLEKLAGIYCFQRAIVAYSAQTTKALWRNHLDSFSIFSLFKSSETADLKQITVAEVNHSNSGLGTSEAGATTTVDSASDVEVVEVVRPVESVAPVQATKTSNLTRPVRSLGNQISTGPSRLTQPPRVTSYILSGTSATSAPQASRPPKRPFTSDYKAPSSTPPVFKGDDDILEWARRKAQTGEKMNDSDFLGVKKYLESTRGDLPFEPIRLRFTPRFMSPTTAFYVNSSSAGASSSQQPNSTSFPASEDTHCDEFAEGPAYYSGFHSSTCLPTFKSKVPSSRRKNVPRMPPIRPEQSHLEGSRKRSAPQIKLDPYKRRRLFGHTDVSGGSHASRSQTTPPNIAEPGPSVPRRSPSPSTEQANATPTNAKADSKSRDIHSTYTAAFVQGIVENTPPRPTHPDVVLVQEIVENTPPPTTHPDLVNEYETRLPQVRRQTRSRETQIHEWKNREEIYKKRMEEVKRRREEEQKTKGKEGPSAREIIEATVPKGAKRSRPPPNLSTPKRSDSFKPAVRRKRSFEEEPEEEELAKKKRRRTVLIEDASDDDEDNVNRMTPKDPKTLIESRSPSPEPTPGPSRPFTAAPPPTSGSVWGEGNVPSMNVPTSSAVPSMGWPFGGTSSINVPPAREPRNGSAPLMSGRIGGGKSYAPKRSSGLRNSYRPYG